MPEKIKTILCPVNLRHAAVTTRAYETAVQLARSNSARLIVVTVALEMERNLRITDSEEFWGKKLAEFLTVHPPAGVEWTQKVLIGGVHRQIVDAAKADGVDLIVMGAANPRVTDYLLGTTASHVVTHAECSVYVVR